MSVVPWIAATLLTQIGFGLPSGAADAGVRDEQPPRAVADNGAMPAEHEPEAQPPEASKDVAGPLVPKEPRAKPSSAAALLRSALATPGGKVSGRSVPLVEVLRSLGDRSTQLKATEDYWRLVEAVAEYNFAWEEFEQFERLKPAHESTQPPTADEQMLATRLAASKARLHDAELALVGAQYQLAAAMRMPSNQPLPLPVDVPHVGPYRTLLGEIYAGRVPPARAVLLDRTLPLRRSAIDSRAAAVEASAEALASAEASFFQGGGELSLVLTLAEEAARQRRAFVADVRAYNDAIAEYALMTPTPPLDPQGLVAMLITRPATDQGVIAASGTSGAVSNGLSNGIERAGFNQPIREPTPAPPRPSDQTHEAQRPADEQDPAQPAAEAIDLSASNLYPALEGMPAQQQAWHLATALCWRPEADAGAEAVTLKQYLALTPVDRRRDAIVAYWQAQQYAARSAVLAQQIEQLETLRSLAESSPLIGATYSAAEADKRQAEVDFLTAQSAMNELAGRRESSGWLTPATAPHAGTYRFSNGQSASSDNGATNASRLATVIRNLHQSVIERAAAVVQADRARAASLATAHEGREQVDRAVAAVREETTQSLTFLARLTEYNVAIADYATAMLPANATSDALVSVLVTKGATSD